LLARADPAELLSQNRVAALLHVRDDAVRSLIARGELETVDGKVPRRMPVGVRAASGEVGRSDDRTLERIDARPWAEVTATQVSRR
jgi:hypothetical protein